MRRDQLYNVTCADVAGVARRCISVTQDYTPQEIVGGLALTFLLLCEHVGIHPGNALEAGGRIINRFHDTDPGNLRGLRRYLKEEIRNG